MFSIFCNAGYTFIALEQIKNSHWIIADKPVAGIDPNDTHYIAYSKHFRCKIWSGDRFFSGMRLLGLR